MPSMPELPEVETVKRGLEMLIVGKTVSKVDFDWPKGFPNSAADVKNFLIGAKVAGVSRRAKVLMIQLDSQYSLVIHLKMTGQMVFVAKAAKKVRSTKDKVQREANFVLRPPSFELSEASLRFGAGHPNDSLVGKLPDKSTRVIITFSDGSNLFFNDQRKFGWMRLLPTVEVPNIDFMKKVGPEPLSDEFTAQVFIERIRRRANTVVKAALLDQTVLAGIGNIYADEGLWGAKIHPSERVRDLSDAQLRLLHKELRFVLNLSIEKGGSTDRNYVNAEGKRGSYMDFARVFRREGQACPRHAGTDIIKTRVAGRGTHLCPKCQTLHLLQ